VSATARIPLQEKPAEGQESGSREAPMLWESADAEPGVLFHLQLLWQHRRVLWRASICALLASTLVAFLVPARYESVPG